METKQDYCSAREAAYRVLMEMETKQAYANLALKKFLDHANIKPVDARLAAQIVYGTVRMRYALDHMIAGFLTRPLADLKKEAHIILRLSLFQLHYLDKAEPYAVVDEGVKLAKRHGSLPLSKLVNAVLRSYLRKVEEKGKDALLPGKQSARRYLHVTLSYPQWLADELLHRFGWEGALAFCEAGNRHPGLFIRTNTQKTDRATLQAQLAEQGIVAVPAGFAPETLQIEKGGAALQKSKLFAEGHFTVQGMASQLVAHALAPQPGQRVLDLCAAPGGKTTHLAALMQNRGELHAFDVHAHKLPLIKESARRLGLGCIKVGQADSRALPESYRGWADCVLLDAPCSGLGVLNERADLRYQHKKEDIATLAALSYQLLEAAAGYVKPGGCICYSTCTVTEEENAAAVQRFVAEHPEFTLRPLTALQTMLPEDKAALQSGMLQLLPQQHGSEGFFISLLQKNKV